MVEMSSPTSNSCLASPQALSMCCVMDRGGSNEFTHFNDRTHASRTETKFGVGELIQTSTNHDGTRTSRPAT